MCDYIMQRGPRRNAKCGAKPKDKSSRCARHRPKQTFECTLCCTAFEEKDAKTLCTDDVCKNNHKVCGGCFERVMEPANVKCPFCRRQLKDAPSPQVVTGHWIEDENLAMSDSDSDLSLDEDDYEDQLTVRRTWIMERISERQLTLALTFVELREMENLAQEIRALQRQSARMDHFLQLLR